MANKENAGNRETAAFSAPYRAIAVNMVSTEQSFTG
jgi:hypothetical protein